jgi:predicted metalloendopeptidase
MRSIFRQPSFFGPQTPDALNPGFDVEPGQALYLALQERVRIW